MAKCHLTLVFPDEARKMPCGRLAIINRATDVLRKAGTSPRLPAGGHTGACDIRRTYLTITFEAKSLDQVAQALVGKGFWVGSDINNCRMLISSGGPGFNIT